MKEPTETIRVSEDLYARIEAHNREDESLGQTLERLLSPPSLHELAGTLSDEEAEAFRDAIEESHRSHDRAIKEEIDGTE